MEPKIFSIWLQPEQKNVKYVFIIDGHKVFSARDALFESSSEVVIAGLWHFICLFEMETAFTVSSDGDQQWEYWHCC